MGLASNNLLFHLFEVNPVSKGDKRYVIVSIRCVKCKVLCVYTKSWKSFKTDYFLTTPFYLIAHVELCVVLTPYVEMATCINYRRRFRSPHHFSKKAKHYSFSYEALIDVDKAMKETFLSFSEVEIHCRDITKAATYGERRELFGIFFIQISFMVCEFGFTLTC